MPAVAGTVLSMRHAVVDKAEMVLALWILVCHLHLTLNLVLSPGLSILQESICTWNYLRRLSEAALSLKSYLHQFPSAGISALSSCVLDMWLTTSCVLLPGLWGLPGRQHTGLWWDSETQVVSCMPLPGIVKTFIPNQVIGPHPQPWFQKQF